MGTRYVKTDIANEAAGPAILLATTATGLIDAYVYANAAVTASNSDGIFGSVSGHDVMVAGFVAGDTYGIRLGDNRAADSGERVIVYSNGVVNASNQAAVAVVAFKSTVDNAGQIQGGLYGVLMSGVSATTQSILKNSGDIFASDYGITRSLAGGDTETILFRNSGTVTADLFAYYGGANNIAVDRIVNTGVFDGDVSMGGGADIYDARGGGRTLGTVFGDGGADTFYGNSAVSEVFDGGADADVFTSDRSAAGGVGDTFRGGNGSDTYYVFTGSGDRLIEAAGLAGDRDLVVSTNSFDLAPLVYFEDVTLTGDGVSAYGNALNNNLTGNALGNTLDGRAGVDTMRGGLGNDAYYVDNTSDRCLEVANQGEFDIVFSTATYTLSANVENLELRGTGNINATGNAQANRLVDGSGSNVMNGGLGNDDIVFIFGSSADTVVFNSALGPNNVDRIFSFGVEDKVHLENAIFTALTTTGALAEAAFRSFASLPAQADLDANDRIIYVSNGQPTGGLFYDPDGNGAAAMVQFATEFGGAFTFSNFVVV